MRFGRQRKTGMAVLGLLILAMPVVLQAKPVSPPFVANDPPASVTQYFAGLRLGVLDSQDAGAAPEKFPRLDVRTGADSSRAAGLKNGKKAFLYSLLLPGAGQFYVGSKVKAAAFFGIEVLSWTGLIVYHHRGDVKTDQFNAYADTYWSNYRYSAFLNTNWGVYDDDSAYNTDGDPSSGFFFTHHLPDTRTQQYYEMIGKYDQFVFGWADVTPLITPDKHATEHTSSALRLHYEDMRHDANNMYDRATTSLLVMMVNHIISGFEAAWSAKRHNDRLDESQQRLSFRAMAASNEYGRFPMLTMQYRF